MASGLPSAVRARVERAVWHDLTGPLFCFGPSWTVQTNDMVLAELLRELFAPIRSNDGDRRLTHRFWVLSPDSDGPGLVVRDMEAVLYEGSTPGAVLSGLIWCINRLVIEESPEHLLVHATAAAKDGKVVLLVGRPNSGKTTLLTALLDRGYEYVTDEVVSVARDLSVTGFPKPLTIDQEAWDLLGHLDPRTGGDADPLHSQHWHVAAERLASVAQGGRVAAIALPSYEAGAETSVQPLSPGEALSRIVPSAFSPEHVALPLDRVSRLARLAEAASSYRLLYGDRKPAIERLLARLHHDGAGLSSSQA